MALALVHNLTIQLRLNRHRITQNCMESVLPLSCCLHSYKKTYQTKTLKLEEELESMNSIKKLRARTGLNKEICFETLHDICKSV